LSGRAADAALHRKRDALHRRRATMAPPKCSFIDERRAAVWLAIRKSTTDHLYKSDAHGGKGKERV
jgi:hypothetical protein